MLLCLAHARPLTMARWHFKVFAVLALLALISTCARLDANTPDWAEFSRHADVDAGLSLHHERYGSGPPILFIHGLGASSYTWRHLATPLAASASVILVDLKGFGDSPKPKDNDYSLYDHARLVYQFIAKNDLRDLTLVGNSYGGGVALVTSLYLERHAPGRLRRLILIGSIGYPQALPQPVKVLTTPVLGPAVVSLIPKKQQEDPCRRDRGLQPALARAGREACLARDGQANHSLRSGRVDETLHPTHHSDTYTFDVKAWIL